MLYSVLLMGAVLMGVGTGIAIGVLMANRGISVHIAHWATRICIVVGFIMCYYSFYILHITIL